MSSSELLLCNLRHASIFLEKKQNEMSLVKTEWEIREIIKPHNYCTVSQISSVMKSDKSKYESIHRNYSQPLIAVMQRYDYMHRNHNIIICTKQKCTYFL